MRPMAWKGRRPGGPRRGIPYDQGVCRPFQTPSVRVGSRVSNPIGRSHFIGGGGQSTAPGGRAVLGTVLFVCMALALVAMWMVDIRMRPAIAAWAEQRAKNVATEAITVAVKEVMEAGVNSVDLTYFHKDNFGRIQSMQFEWGEINRIMADATERIRSRFQQLQEETISVPIGQIIGLDLIAGRGPKVPVKIVPIGSVQANPMVEFQQAGINQTLYTMFLKVTMTVRIVVPAVAKDVNVESKVHITQQIVLGQVPEYYLNWSGNPRDLPGGGMLIPGAVGPLKQETNETRNQGAE